MDTKPDQYSNEWYRRRLNRIDHNLDRQDNELNDQHATVTELTKKVAALEAARRDDAAKIGEMNSRIEVLETWMQEIEAIRAAKKTGNAA